MQIPSIPELEVTAVPIAVFILLLIALAGLVIEALYWLKRKLIAECRRDVHDFVQGNRQS